MAYLIKLIDTNIDYTFTKMLKIDFILISKTPSWVVTLNSDKSDKHNNIYFLIN